MKFEVCEYQVCESFFPAIINDDYSGMSDEDSAACRDFLESLPNGHFDCDSNEPPFFAFCDIARVKGMCHTLRHLVRA